MQLVLAVGLPLFLTVGGIAAWLSTRKGGSFDPPPQQVWRDDSLDGWRKERDATAEERRAARASEPQHLSTGGEEQQETKKHHQRLGG